MREYYATFLLLRILRLPQWDQLAAAAIFKREEAGDRQFTVIWFSIGSWWASVASSGNDGDEKRRQAPCDQLISKAKLFDEKRNQVISYFTIRKIFKFHKIV